MPDYNTKTQRKYSYYGAGFEVVLHQAPMMKIGREWVLNLNPAVIDRMILDEIPRQPSRLTGNQVRFIRDFAGMTLKAFAERFGVSHAAVKKWENAGDRPTSMAWSTEKDIRLFVLLQEDADAEDFQACYEDLVAAPSRKLAPIHIDLEAMAVT